MAADEWVSTEGNFRFTGKASTAGSAMNAGPVENGEKNGPFRKTVRKNAGVHFTPMYVLTVKPGQIDLASAIMILKILKSML